MVCRAQEDSGEKGTQESEENSLMRILKTGAPCPCCGRPIRITDPDALRLLGMMADLMGLPTAEAPEDEEEDGTVVPTGEEDL